MSGALALAGTALAVYDSLGTGVALGSVYLTGFEVPDTIPWGTKQGIKEHIYPGGQNELQPMGPIREPIRWSGQMFSSPFGPSATDRARMLDQLCAAGAIVPLAWGNLNFDVVIETFEADYKHEWQGRYSIACKVLWDYQPQTATPSPAVATGNDLGAAMGFFA